MRESSSDAQLRLINACDQALAQFPTESLASERVMADVHARFVGHESAGGHAIASTVARFRTLRSTFEHVKRCQSRRRQAPRASRWHLDDEVYQAMAQLTERYPMRTEPPRTDLPRAIRDHWRPEEYELVAHAKKSVGDPASYPRSEVKARLKFLDLGGSRKRTSGAVERVSREISRAHKFRLENCQDGNLWFAHPQYRRDELSRNCNNTDRTVLTHINLGAFQQLDRAALCNPQRPGNLTDVEEKFDGNDEDMPSASIAEGEGDATHDESVQSLVRSPQDPSSPGGHSASAVAEEAPSTQSEERAATGAMNNESRMVVRGMQKNNAHRPCRVPWSTNELQMIAQAMEALLDSDASPVGAKEFYSVFLSLGGSAKRTPNAVITVRCKMLRCQRFVVDCADTWKQWFEFTVKHREVLAQSCNPSDRNVLLQMDQVVLQALDRITGRSTGLRTTRLCIATGHSTPAELPERNDDDTSSEEVFTEPDVNESTLSTTTLPQCSTPSAVLPVPGDHQQENERAEPISRHDFNFNTLGNAATHSSREASDSTRGNDDTQVNGRSFDPEDMAAASTCIPLHETEAEVDHMEVDQIEVERVEVDRMEVGEMDVDRMEVDQTEDDSTMALSSNQMEVDRMGVDQTEDDGEMAEWTAFRA